MDALARLSSDAAEALRIADDVLAALAEGDSRARVDAWRVRGQALRALALHADAVESFANAAAAARAMGDELLAAQVQVGSIDSLAMLGRFDDASALAGELERAFRAAGADDAAGKTLYNLGAAQLRQERYRDALESFERAGVLFAASPNADQLLPHVQTNTALALTFLDRTDEALVLYASARESFAERDRVVEASVVDANVGFVHAVSGRFVDALASLNRARDAFAKLGRFHEAARYEIDAGDAYRALNLRPEARACYDRALETFRPMESELDEARALLGRAATLDESSAAEIDESLDRAQAIFAAQRVGPQQAQVELLKAIRALRAGREDEARSFARSAGRRFSRAKLAGWAAEASLIALDAEPEVPASARLRRLRRIRRVASRTGRGWLECRALLALGRVFAGGGKTAFALRCFRTGVAILEGVRAQLMQEELHSSFLRDKLDLHEALIGLLLARGRAGDINEAFEQVERARSRLLLERVLSTAPDSGAGLPTALPTALSERLVDLRARISRAYHREIAIDDSDARRMQVSDSDELDALERQYRELLRDAEIESKASGQSGGLLTAPLLAGELCGATRSGLVPD